MREIALPIHRRLVRQLLDMRHVDDLAALQPRGHPRELPHLHPFLDRPGPGGRAVPGELDEAAAIDPQEIDDLAKPALDRWVEIGGRQMAERGGQGGQELLEAQPLGERELHPPAVQDAGEGLAEEAEPLHQVVRPGVAGTEGAEGEHAEEGSPGAQGDHTSSVCPRARSWPDRSPLPREAHRVARTDDLPFPQSPDTQGNRSAAVTCGGSSRPGRAHESRSLGLPSACSRARPIHAQERDDLLERALDRHVGVGGGDVNQLGGQRREERLEAQAARQHELRRPVRPPASQVAQLHLSPPRPASPADRAAILGRFRRTSDRMSAPCACSG